MTTPTSRILTQINNGGGVLHIQQYQSRVTGHYSSVREWNHPHVNLVSFKFNIHEVEQLEKHINETAKREEDWRAQVEAEFETLVEEQQEFEDIVFVDAIDVYRNIPQKLLHFIKWAVDEVHFKYLLKTDDDTFVDLERVVRTSHMWTNITRLWWGRFRHNWAVEHHGKWEELQYKAPAYPKFACGSGYVIGRDIAQWLASNVDHLHFFQGEDVSMGIWLSAISPTYMDDPLWQCEAQCISNMNAAPDLHPDDIRQLWDNNIRCSDPCGCD